MLNSVTIIAIAVFALVVSCSRQRTTENAVSRPAIYDAWEARYSYQLENRKMVPIFQGKEIGRSWKRDAQGRLEAARYVGSASENDEDLFSLHLRKMDRMRSRNWESAKKARTDAVREMLADQEENADDPLLELDFEEEEEEFIPPPNFLPAGIDLETGSPDSPSLETPGDAQDSLGMPFTPLPL